MLTPLDTAQARLGRRSTLSAQWSPAHLKVIPVVTSDEQADYLADQAERVCALASTLTRTPWPKLVTMTLLAHHQDWLTAADQAVTTKRLFWCDDYILAAYVRENGGTTFSTPDVLAALTAAGTFTTELSEVLLGSLLRNYHVDLGFRESAMRFAAETDAWKARGAAHAMTRRQAWTDAPAAARFILEAVDHSLGDPGEVRAWVEAGARGITSIADDPGGSHNLELYLGGHIAQHGGARSDIFPFILEGIRTVIAERPGLSDPLPAVIRQMRESITENYGHAVAANLLMNRFKHVNEADRLTVARIILEP